MKKKYLVNLYDRYSKERIAQLLVTAVNTYEALNAEKKKKGSNVK